MNKEWSELNKHMQEKLRKEQTYREGIETLLVLRGKMMAELFRMKHELSEEEFSRMPLRHMKDEGVEEILRLFY
ncbi:MAG: hypothetical protein PUE22_06990 [Roseburia porci]|uniref:hypothetical protein n=1 Tax=Roseburia porci TaxID=2605790 RepID=UPI001A9B47E9|nr:hypothetical protein [Roseburia porci]MDD6743230.1 hypothetical protein [Roseburia porci]